MQRPHGGQIKKATEDVSSGELRESATYNRSRLLDSLDRLAELGMPIDVGQSNVKSIGLELLLALTVPLWMWRLRRLEQCQDKAILKVGKLLDDSLKLAVLEDQKLAVNLACAQIILALRHGVQSFTSRAVAYWAFFRIGGLLTAIPSVRRAVQEATRLSSDSRFRTWQQPIVGDWMGFLLPWSFPRKLTHRRIEQLKYAIRDDLDLTLSAFGSEYELASNLFATESLDSTSKCLQHLKDTILAIQNNEAPVTDFGLAGTIAKLNPGGSMMPSLSGGLGADPVTDRSKVERVFASTFKLSLAAVVAAVLRDYPTVVKTKAIIRSQAGSQNWPASMPPISLILIVHASVVATWSQSMGVSARLQLVREIMFVLRLAYNNRSSYSWATHLILGELGVAFGRSQFAYSQFRLARLKAKESGYLLPLAVIQERIATFSLIVGDQELGRRQLKEARSLYAQWGSALKLNQLDYQYSYLRLDREKKRVVGKMSGGDSKLHLSEHLNLRLISGAENRASANLHLRDLIQLLSPEMGASPQAKESLTNRVNNYVENIKQITFNTTLLGIIRQHNERAIEHAAQAEERLFVAANYAQCTELCSDLIISVYDQKNQLYFFGLGDGFDRGPPTVMRSIALSGAIEAAINMADGSPFMRMSAVVESFNRIICSALSDELSLFRLSLFVIDPNNGEGLYFNAANHATYIKRGEQILPLLVRTPPLGQSEFDLAHAIHPFHLELGDVLLTHTNGLLNERLEGGSGISRQLIRRSMLSAPSPLGLAVVLEGCLKKQTEMGLKDDAAYILVSRRGL
jgi:hypothetical protein